MTSVYRPLTFITMSSTSLTDVLGEVSDTCQLCSDWHTADIDMIDYIVLKLDGCDESLRYYIGSLSPQLPEYSTLRSLHGCIGELQVYWNTKLLRIGGGSSPCEGRPKKFINIELVSHSMLCSTIMLFWGFFCCCLLLFVVGFWFCCCCCLLVFCLFVCLFVFYSLNTCVK